MSENISIPTTISGQAVIVRPSTPLPWPLLMVFHGYNGNAEEMLARAQMLPGSERCLVCSLQALHPFYQRDHATVGYSWMTSAHRKETIAENIRYVDTALETLLAAEPTSGVVVYAGFSQGASMAWRAALCGTQAAAGVIINGGDIPPDVSAGALENTPPAFIARGKQDTFFTEEKMAGDMKKLPQGRTASFTFDGAHDWNEAFALEAGTYLERVI